MSDLVKRLLDGVVKSDGDNYHLCASEAMFEAVYRIEQLERELAETKQHAQAGWDMHVYWNERYMGAAKERDRLSNKLAAEKALADRLYHAMTDIDPSYDLKSRAISAYRKTRGL